MTLAGCATAEATAGRGRRALGSTGLFVSGLGFGCYRIDDRTPQHSAALGMALERGCNLIDTSTNYALGASEIAVGNALQSQSRQAIVVVSKIGYVQGPNLQLAHERETAGKPFPEMVKYMDSCWHCIHPEFLADQLERSLARLRLETLDVCLLHNPEYFLSDGLHRGVEPVEQLHEQFYRRIRDAFVTLEEAVALGRIRWYGVSSNTVAQSEDDPEGTSLARFLAAAREAGGAGHHFRVLQLPMNLLEPGGVLERKHEGMTVLELASQSGLGVLINRPLNAAYGHGMIRLADTPDGENAQNVAAISRHLDPALPAERRGEPLSRKVLWVLASTPGVSSVLLGMRRPEWVEDAMPVLDWPALPDVMPAYEAFTK